MEHVLFGGIIIALFLTLIKKNKVEFKNEKNGKQG
jgi:hypothetical protein